MRDVLAIILGGGRGSRLYPLTKLRAKPAVPFAGKYRLIDIPVSNCINSNIQKIYVLTQFNSASLNRHISLTYHFGALFDGFVEVLAAQQTVEREDWFQGTADAVRQYLQTISELAVCEYLILSGDHLYRMNYEHFINHHRETNADITIPVLAVPEKKASDFGLLKIDESNRVIEFTEKPKGSALKAMQVDTRILGLNNKEAQHAPYIASMGIYTFKKQVLLDLLKKDVSQTDFGKEIIPSAIKDYNIKTYLYKGYWEDIGTIGAFYEANMALLKYPRPEFSFYNPAFPIFTHQRFLPPSRIVDSEINNSMIAEGSIIYSSRICHSLLGVRTYINEGVHIKDSLVMGADHFLHRDQRDKEIATGRIPIGIGKNTVIKKAIIDKNARIGNNVQIINKDNVMEAEREDLGFYIRDGIVIILKNAEITHNTII